MPKWAKGTVFIHADTNVEFEVIEVTDPLPPEGRIGYVLKPVNEGGPVIRRFESELADCKDGPTTGEFISKPQFKFKISDELRQMEEFMRTFPVPLLVDPHASTAYFRRRG